MRKQAYSILVYNNPGLLSRMAGLFSRRGYNIESITAGTTADPRFTRITIVASGDEQILSQIEKQVRKMEDVIEIKPLNDSNSVCRELVMIKVRANASERAELISLADIFRAKIVDVEKDCLMIELTGTESKLKAFMELLDGYEILVTAVVGMIGIRPTMAAIREGKRIALANKETLVCGGELVMEEAHDFGAEILPVDSEHSALFQSLQGNRDRGEVKRLILTCSGGPFFGKTTEELQHVTREDALHNPNWSMGAKITVDSASLMNKGLEVIEAMHLYHMTAEKVSIVVHRESIIHSLVEYCDNAMIAQLGSADMRLPIQYALTWPRRVPGPAKELDLWNCGPLTFAHPDLDTFRCLKLALDAARTGGTAGAILNGANEAAVAQFLAGKIRFLEIADKVQRAMETVPVIQNPSLTQVLEADAAAREAAR